MKMNSLYSIVKIECVKYWSKPRTYIGFIAITTIVLLIQLALYTDGKNYWDFLTQSLSQSFEIEGMEFNGNMVCFIILQTLIVQMPLMVALVSGDIVSGEVQAGTIRSLLTKPVSRTKILISKFIAAEIYTLALIIWLGVLAYFLSLFLFGKGDVVVLKSDALTVIRSADVGIRFLFAFFMAFLSLSVINCFAFMLSTFSNNSITPIVISMSVVILFTIIGTFDIPLFESIKPYLFTTHTIVWRNFFDNPIDWELIISSTCFLIVHIVIFMGASIYYFNKKDFLQ